MRPDNSFAVRNPILPGFHPDPSICRVENDFYIATSTFEYFPGVIIHHSRNLADWEFKSYALTRPTQLDMRGNPPSGGVWAPCLSYSEGRFHLIFTDVKEWAGSGSGGVGGFKDTHNYLVTAENVEGPWSDPIYLNSSGFDPSLFHDDDGRKWLLNMIWDYRPGQNSFAGVAMQEYSAAQERLVGPVKNIFTGSERKLTEGPHLYRRGGYYYLMTAEGGTSYSHAVTLCRSRSIHGPYELHPQTHLLTAMADHRSMEGVGGQPEKIRAACHPGLQKAGHGSMAPWTDDEWVLAHLCGRPVDESMRCSLGRETALQRLIWKDDGWPYVEGEGVPETAQFSFREGMPSPSINTAAALHWREDFDGDAWSPALNTLRLPAGTDYSLTGNGKLRLFGRESISSRFRQTLLARRVQHFNWSAETCVDFIPENFQQLAGLIVRYDESTQLILRVSITDGQRTLGIIDCDLGLLHMPLGADERVLAEGAVHLGVDVRGRGLQFRSRQNGESWMPIGPVFDSSKMSDDYVHPMGFTGTFVGLGCWDVSGRRRHADFDFLLYRGE